MPTPIIMPKFGMTQEEGTIIRWLKNAGERVEKGEPLLEVQTDKVDMDVEAPASGILGALQFGADATVPVATVIAQVFALHEALPSAESTLTTERPTVSAPAPKATPLAQRIANDKGIDLAQIAGSGPAGRILKADLAPALTDGTSTLFSNQSAAEETHRPRATPAARRLAHDAQIDLTLVKGTGPLGRIQAADIATHLLPPPQPPSPPHPVTPSSPHPVTLKGLRKTIATRLSQSWQSAPHVTFAISIDMTRADALRTLLAGEVEKAGGKLTPTVIIAKAVAVALQRHPRLNAWLISEQNNLLLTEHQQINLGIAVALEDGLIVPVIKEVQTLGLAAIASQLVDLASRARANQLQPAEVMDGTFTISNLGMFPLDHFTAIINPPQVAILAVAQSQIQPVWDGSAFQPRPLLQLTLSADHRAIDGAVAAAFLAEVKRLLEAPERMLL